MATFIYACLEQSGRDAVVGSGERILLVVSGGRGNSLRARAGSQAERGSESAAGISGGRHEREKALLRGG